MVITPRVTLSLPRTLPSPNMCLVANVTDDPAGSMAYRPAGGACTAVLVVDMTAVPFVWDQGREKPGAVALAESPGAEHVLRSGRSRPLAPSRASTRAERVRFCKSKTYLRAQASKL
jgi:hypothetical protein